MPRLIARQLCQKQVVGLHPQRTGHQRFRCNHMAVEQMHMVGMKGQGVLQSFLDTQIFD
ncbi:hypothetical protein Pgy4_28735 [Pseudomonas savastanoi pv. glycinea str. race 4]|uniref:Uncharacterized protein n=1 Tax=Pseudomonas savastanoi pv. glycinea str. race 4 TaxID=875330 RepID=F3CCL4_PSESG|nr:hypothetical protein Pgy4_28735 [Pseudomonas savastanoi pv. glycinea str. race 4]